MTKVSAGRLGVHFDEWKMGLWAKLCLAGLVPLAIAMLWTTPVRADSPPVLDNPTVVPSTPVALDSEYPVVLTVTFSDPDEGDTHSVRIEWDDGTVCEANSVAPDESVSEYCSIDNDTNTIRAAHRYQATGVYAPVITLSTVGITQGGKNGKRYRYVVVYDDSKGHIKGSGGFDFDHPYNQFDTATGPAQFGFTVGYNADGTFRGNSRVRFSLYSSTLSEIFTLSSTSFSWMVISGANAIVSGVGTINGVSYNFVVSIIDGALLTPSGSDRFRIRITPVASGALFYDNEFAPIPTRDIMLFDPVTVAGGLIVIADAPGMAAAVGGMPLVVIGSAPQAAVDQIGPSQDLFLPLAVDRQ